MKSGNGNGLADHLVLTNGKRPKAMVVRRLYEEFSGGVTCMHEDTRTSPKPLQLLAFNANDQNAFKHACVAYTHVYHM